MNALIVIFLIAVTAVEACQTPALSTLFITRHKNQTQILSTGSYATNGKAMPVDMCDIKSLEFTGEVQLTIRKTVDSFNEEECSCFVENSGFSVLLNDGMATDKCWFAKLQINDDILTCDGEMTESIHDYSDKIESSMQYAFISITHSFSYEGRYLIVMTIRSKETADMECKRTPSPKPSRPSTPAVTSTRQAQPSSQPGPSPTTGRTDIQLEMCKTGKQKIRNNITMTTPNAGGQVFHSCWCFIDSSSKNPYLISTIMHEECLFDMVEINNKQVTCDEINNFEHKGSKTFIWIKLRTDNGGQKQEVFKLSTKEKVTIRCDGMRKRDPLPQLTFEQDQGQVTIRTEGDRIVYTFQCPYSGYIIGLAIPCWSTFGLVLIIIGLLLILYKGINVGIDSVKAEENKHPRSSPLSNTTDKIGVNEERTHLLSEKEKSNPQEI